jgi:periplasmic protein TonB
MSIVRRLLLSIGAAAPLACAGAPPANLQKLVAPPPISIPSGTPVKFDPAHPVIVRYQYYPAASKQHHEQGSCMVKLTIGTDGLVRNAELTISSGFERLDEACLKAFRLERFLPATQDGKPVISTIELPINWRLN